MTSAVDVQIETTTPRRREAALTAGWYALVVAIVLNVPVLMWAFLMVGLGLTMDDGPWWSWVRAIPFALLILAVPATLLAAFLWLVRRLLAGRPSLLLSGALALVGGSVWWGVFAS